MEENYELSSWQKSILAYEAPFKYTCRDKYDGFVTGYSSCKEVYLGGRYAHRNLHSYQLFFDAKLFLEAIKIWDELKLPKFEYDLEDKFNTYIRVKEKAFPSVAFADVFITIIKAIPQSGVTILDKIAIDTKTGKFVNNRYNCFIYLFNNIPKLSEIQDAEICSEKGQVLSYDNCGLCSWFARNFKHLE